MHIQLTDILACPVCGPPFGLIVRSDRMRDRHIVEGALACPNCERKFPVLGGVALLDPADERIGGDTAAAADDADPAAAIRIAALLGLTEARGWVLLAGPAAATADAVRGLADNIEVVADARYAPDGSGNRIALGDRLPFYDAKLHGIWLSGDSADRWLEEAARTLHPIGRLVTEPAPADYTTRIEAAGMKIIAEQDRTVLAVRS